MAHVESPESVHGVPVTRSLTDQELRDRLPVDLTKFRACFAAHDIRVAYLFGSRSRGDHRPDSDIDILYEFEPGKASMATHLALEAEVAALSPVTVELASDVRQTFKKYIARDIVRLYGRR